MGTLDFFNFVRSFFFKSLFQKIIGLVSLLFDKLSSMPSIVSVPATSSYVNVIAVPANRIEAILSSLLFIALCKFHTLGSGLYSPNVLKNNDENWKMFWKGLKSTKYGADHCVIIGVDLTPTDIDHLDGTNQIMFFNSKSLKNVHLMMKDIWCVR